jgi:ATPase subunit of ABC transporter with duplicated ATPase domains
MSMIQLQGVCLAFPHKTCFSNFDGHIDWGQRIAIVGDNGSGKSSLLRLLHGGQTPQAGLVRRPVDLRIGHVPQVLAAQHGLSGGQQLNQALSQALAGQPDLLLLDEPTNHLDADNRRSLCRMLRHFYGAIVLVSHDVALVDEICDTVWLLERGELQVHSGRYTDLCAERAQQRERIERQVDEVKRARTAAHDARMQEQQRASKARARGERAIAEHKWPTVKSMTKLGRGNETAGRRQAALVERQQDLGRQLEALRQPPALVPRFNLTPATQAQGVVVQISGGEAGYAQQRVVTGIHLKLSTGERLALTGRNGCGKSTLAMAIAGRAPAERLAGTWITPDGGEIGYLDQHYAVLQTGMTVLQTLRQVAPAWSEQQLRHRLSDFLFCSDAAVQADVATLSGGERARLALACIAARPPRLLLLDEVSNNLDLTARQHVIEVLRAYPGTMLLISHDAAFLQDLGEVECYPLTGPA